MNGLRLSGEETEKMKVNRKKTVLGRAYAIGYRFIDHPIVEKDIGVSRYKIIKPSKAYGYADPFPVIYNNKHYIFAEIMNKYTEFGQIGVCCVEEGNVFQQVIHEDFHMSYPNVFFWNGCMYMIPETNFASDLRIYIAEEFPYKWKLYKILLTNIKLVDFSFFIEGNILYGIATDIRQKPYYNRYFQIDLLSMQIEELFFDKKGCIDKRSGGNFFSWKDEWYIPMQECSNCYGEYLHFVKVKNFNAKDMEQEKIFELHADELKINKFIFFDRVHTYNYNSGFEVIDIYLYEFDLKKIGMIIKNCRRKGR